MDNEIYVKKNNHFFRNFILCLFFIFICLYVVKENGYLAHKMSSITYDTENKIKQFENGMGDEIKSGEYMVTTKNNYSNNTSRFGEKLSDTISFMAEKSISIFDGVIKYLFG